jgi:hypothetical protein
MSFVPIIVSAQILTGQFGRDHRYCHRPRISQALIDWWAIFVFLSQADEKLKRHNASADDDTCADQKTVFGRAV